jgi:hypothetical protein
MGRMSRPTCGVEFCCNPATFHINEDNIGDCGQHHNWSYSIAGVMSYYKEECPRCVKEREAENARKVQS